mmetsp:Transcript_38111/g.119633  ORF Transcript_38111/g.119633 Transcript_38111/m.119633 type:complete len:247 (+) Transcript_38111:1480-2220(+)
MAEDSAMAWASLYRCISARSASWRWLACSCAVAASSTLRRADMSSLLTSSSRRLRDACAVWDSCSSRSPSSCCCSSRRSDRAWNSLATLSSELSSPERDAARARASESAAEASFSDCSLVSTDSRLELPPVMLPEGSKMSPAYVAVRVRTCAWKAMALAASWLSQTMVEPKTYSMAARITSSKPTSSRASLALAPWCCATCCAVATLRGSTTFPRILSSGMMVTRLRSLPRCISAFAVVAVSTTTW